MFSAFISPSSILNWATPQRMGAFSSDLLKSRPKPLDTLMPVNSAKAEGDLAVGQNEGKAAIGIRHHLMQRVAGAVDDGAGLHDTNQRRRSAGLLALKLFELDIFDAHVNVHRGDFLSGIDPCVS